MEIKNKQVKINHPYKQLKINIRFIIKEEERVVIGIVKFMNFSDIRIAKLIKQSIIDRKYDNSNDENITINIINEICRGNGFTPEWNKSIYPKLKMNKRYTAKAICDPRDTWSKEEGINIVIQKLTNKILNAIDNRIDLALNCFSNVIQELWEED